ncbi:MAG: zinc ribbon domain-containing protein [Myxococcales bacterium]|nr:zinc ribbon domain-containing protein [Myxococcales bacterium]
MPTYVYETVPADGSPGQVFEIQQRMADPALERHPDTGEPVQRVLTAPFLGGFAAGKAACEAPSFGGGCGMGACGMGGCGSDES